MASPFAHFTTQVIGVPHDEPQTITIQKLSGRWVERAQAAAAAGIVQGRGFAEKMQRLLSGSEEDAKAFIADPFNGYDRATVLQGGITGWSYDLPVTADNIGKLDDDICEFVAGEILKLTKPALFEAPETVKKND